MPKREVDEIEPQQYQSIVFLVFYIL